MNRIEFILRLSLIAIAYYLAINAEANAQPYLYFSDPDLSVISRVNPRNDPNNLDFTTILSAEDSEDVLKPWAFAIDELNGKIYWTDPALRTVNRANFDGTNLQVIIQPADAGVAEGIAVDQARGKIYWTDTLKDIILQANTDGSGIVQIVTSGNVNPTEIDLHPSQSKIYWVNTGNNTLRRANFDGTSAETLVISGGFVLAGGIAVDSRNNLIYLSARPPPAATGLPPFILRTGINGENPQAAVTLQLGDAPLGVALDLAAGFIHWSDDNLNRYYRAALGPSPTPQHLFSIETSPAHPALIGPCDANFSTDSDGDGTADCSDSCLLDPGKSVPGLCGCGVAETDADGDGVPDCLDLCSSDPAKVGPGACGCSVSDIDTDIDGVLDCFDQCPLDTTKIVPGTCGCGAFEFDGGKLGIQCQASPLSCTADRDFDGTSDCEDQCPTDSDKVTPQFCGCEFYENTNETGELQCEPDPLLAFETVLILPPLVIVKGNDVTVIVKRFSGVKQVIAATQSPEGTLRAEFAVTSRRGKLTFRYDIRLKPVGRLSRSQDVARRLTKRNQTTYRDLTPGRYKVKYRAQIMRDKKVIDNTNFSPAVSFQIF